MAFDYRLKKEKDFSRVFKEGKRIFSDSLTLIYLPSKELKMGVAVSKKHGGSVKRNRIKRLLRENYRVFEDKISSGLSIVFLLKKKANIDEVNFNLVKSDMEYILKKANVLI